MSLIALLLLRCATAGIAAEPVRDVLFADDFGGALRPCWQVYDNWSKAALKLVPSPVPGHGQALQVELDDKSTVEWFDKGFLIVLDQPIPWSRLDAIEATYQLDKPVGNVRCFLSETDGDWWDVTNSKPEIGKPATLTLRRDDFRLAWTDNKGPVHEKDTAVSRVFFSIHNLDPVNTGHRFVFTLDDVSVATELCAEPYRVQADEVISDLVVAPHSAAPTTPDPREIAPPAVVMREGVPFALLWALWQDRGVSVDVYACSPSGPRLAQVTVVGRTYAPVGQPSSSFLVSTEAPAGTELRAGAHVPVTTRWTDGSEFTAQLLLTRPLNPTEIIAIAARSGGIALALSGELSSLQPRPALSLVVPRALELRVKWPRTVRGSEGLVLVADPPSLLPSYGPDWFCRLSYVADHPLPVGHLSLTATLAVEGGAPVTLSRSIDVPDIDVAAVRARLPEARTKMQALAARRTAKDRPAAWDVKGGLVGQPEVRVRKRVDPAKWSLIKDPVTWEDMGGGFAGGAQCGINKEDLDLYFSHYDFGRVIKPHLGYFTRDDWRQNLAECKRRNLIIMSAWGFVPDTRNSEGMFGELVITPEHQAAINAIMGRQFLGWEDGEQDGRYIGSYAPQQHPTTRAEARKLFDDWHEQKILEPFQHYMVALGSLSFSHYYGEDSHRILGLETAQGLPSDILEWSFLRGAGRQYGALTWNCISIFNRWGYKSYTGTGADHGPDKGTSVSLLRRLYYVTYLYGSATNGFESSYFLADKDAQGFPKLSPIGEANVEAVKWCREHPQRGVCYSPVAIMLDRNAGWVPPRHLYTGARHLVWGNLPYSKGDHATDALFRMVFPQYEDCSYYEDERGYLTETPCGDQFEVLLSNAQPRVLSNYKAVVVPGDVAMDQALAERLSGFVQGGGDLFIDAAQAAGLPEKVTGVKVSAERRTAQMSLSLSGGEPVQEVPYVYRPLEPKGARVLAVTETGDPLMTVSACGKGRVIAIAAENMVSAKWQDPSDKTDVPLQYHLLQSVQQTLGGYFRGLALVSVEPGGIQYLVNVTDDPNELIVTLVNNAHQDWQGTVTPKGGGKWRIEGWLPKSAETTGEKLTVSVPAGDLAVYRLRRNR